MGTSYEDAMHDSYTNDTYDQYHELLDKVARAKSLTELSSALEKVSKYIDTNEILKNGDNDEINIKETVTAHAYSNIKDLVDKDRRLRLLKFLATSILAFLVGALLTLLLRWLNIPI